MNYATIEDFITYMYLNYHTYDPSKGAFSTWVNNYIKGYRTQCIRKVEKYHRTTKLSDCTYDIDTSVEDREQYNIIMTAINRLNPRIALIIKDFFFENYSMKELITKHKLSRARIHQLIHNGIYSLRRAFGVNNNSTVEIGRVLMQRSYTK